MEFSIVMCRKSYDIFHSGQQKNIFMLIQMREMVVLHQNLPMPQTSNEAPAMGGTRFLTMNILRVLIIEKLSVYVDSILGSSSVFYALRTLRSWGLSTYALHEDASCFSSWAALGYLMLPCLHPATAINIMFSGVCVWTAQ